MVTYSESEYNMQPKGFVKFIYTTFNYSWEKETTYIYEYILQNAH